MFSGSSCSGPYAPSNCCTLGNPCSEGEGDCDKDVDCKGELICGTNNCDNSFPNSNFDCCKQPEGGNIITFMNSFIYLGAIGIPPCFVFNMATMAKMVLPFVKMIL